MKRWRCQVCREWFRFPVQPEQILPACLLHNDPGKIKKKKKQQLAIVFAKFLYCEGCS